MPYRVTLDAGGAAPASQTYTLAVVLDNEDQGAPGYDFISEPEAQHRAVRRVVQRSLRHGPADHDELRRDHQRRVRVRLRWRPGRVRGAVTGTAARQSPRAVAAGARAANSAPPPRLGRRSAARAPVTLNVGAAFRRLPPESPLHASSLVAAAAASPPRRCLWWWAAGRRRRVGTTAAGAAVVGAGAAGRLRRPRANTKLLVLSHTMTVPSGRTTSTTSRPRRTPTRSRTSLSRHDGGDGVRRRPGLGHHHEHQRRFRNRPADRAPEPPPLGPRPCRAPPARPAAGLRGAQRHRPLQGLQRPARPSRGRRAAASARPGAWRAQLQAEQRLSPATAARSSPSCSRAAPRRPRRRSRSGCVDRRSTAGRRRSGSRSGTGVEMADCVVCRADEALYDAKQDGRDRVAFAA